MVVVGAWPSPCPKKNRRKLFQYIIRGFPLRHDIAHKHLVAENCVNAQFCVNDYTKLGHALILRLHQIKTGLNFKTCLNFRSPDVYVHNDIKKR